MKKFWRILTKVLLLVSGLAVAVLFVIVLSSAVKKNESLTCRALKVKIDYESGLAFVNESDIEERINYLSGGSITGKQLSQIDFHTLEKEVEKNPYVLNAEVFSDRLQQVYVEVVQKRPLIRVMNNDGVGYYVSENNDLMPLSDKFTSRVPVVLGYVSVKGKPERDSVLQSVLFSLFQVINKDVFLHALVDQVYVHENGELDLIPKTGKHVIHFGDGANKVDDKFERLKIFYREGLTKVGWYKYKSISLKFDGQVVCEKQDSVTTAVEPATETTP